MLRKFAVGLAALGALNAAQVKALGLGEVTVHSALNQPLEAEIDLLQIRDLAASQIITGLADSDEFYLAGVKPTAVLSDIRFELDIRESGGKIFLTTREPIREPFLNFLVEVNWPSGRLVREYTVLLDPPVFTAQDLAPRSVPVPPATQGRAPAPAVTSAAATTAPRTAAGDSYRVGNDDTLWSIALNTRPDRGVSPQQMMLAIQRANPDAFIGNNINQLKSGVVLRIPGAPEIASLGGQDPVEEVKRQNVAWRGNAGQAPVSQGGRLDATRGESGDGAAAAESEASRLRIVSKPAQAETETEQAPGTLVADDTPADAAIADPLAEELLNKNLELEEQLVVTLEGLDKVERDNVELFQRLDQLGNQMASLQRLLELKDQQLAELQVSLSQPQGQVSPPPPPVQESPGMMAALLKYPASLAGAVIALLVLVGGLLFVRNRKQKEERAVGAAMAELDARDGKGGEGAADLKIAAGAAAAAAALDTVQAQTRGQQDALDELAVEEDPNDPFNLGSDDAGDEFDSLTSDDLEASLGDDLDMDLKIDELIEEDPEMAEFAESLLSDDDYDLGVEEPEPQDMLDAEIQDAVEEKGDDLDFVLSDRQSSSAEPVEIEPEEGDDLDFILGANAEETSVEEPEQSPVASEALEDEEESELLGELDDLLAMDTADKATVDGIDETAPTEFEAIQESEDESELLDELDDLLGESAAAGVLKEEPAAGAVENDELDDFFDQPEAESVADTAAATDAAAAAVAAEQIEEPVSGPQVEEDRDDIDRLLAESGADLGAAEAMKPQEAPAVETVEDEADTDLDALFASFGDEETATPVKEDPVAPEVFGEFDAFEGFDLELEGEDEGAVSAEPAAGVDDKASTASEAVAEDELDLAGDEDLEAELSQMLEEEGNSLSLEETDLGEGESETDYLEGADEVGTKLDLARAYIDMDDSDGARDILDEVLSEGTAPQVEEAKQLLASFKQ